MSSPDDPLARLALAAKLFLEPEDPPAIDDAGTVELARRMGAPADNDAIPPALERLGDFELVLQLGRGANGIVYEARQLSLGRRRVALKVLAFASGLGPSHLARFRREAECGARLAHPNLVTVHGVGEADGRHFIVQELVEGGRTLADWIDEARSRSRVDADEFSFRSLATMFASVADALEAVHRADLVHRDVKPSNVLITRDGQPKLGDFGLALQRDAFALTRPGQTPGTPAYMSPEQAGGGIVDARSDVFALGATLYEALTFVRAFDGDSIFEVLEKIRVHEPLDARDVRPSVPRDLAIICAKALEKSPERRYASAQALGDDLRRFLANEPITATPQSLLRRTVKWTQRHPTLATSGALLVAALVTVSTLLVHVVSTQERLELFTDRGQLEVLEERSARLDVPAEEVLADLEAWHRDASTLVAKLPHYRARLASLDVSDRGSVRASGLAEERHDADLPELSRLVTALEDLERGPGRASLPGAAALIGEIRSLRSRSIDAAPDRWTEAIQDVRESRLYGGLVLTPQLGLVPLRRDPNSGLWEFHHVLSGDPPQCGSDGRWKIEARTGIVLVLVPGGRVCIGADPADSGSANFDPGEQSVATPAFDVDLAPYFIAKYELTQAQYERATGSNPSRYSPTTAADSRVGPTNPVESVDWTRCAAALRGFGLVLPDEMQWEHAVRGGARGPWICGDAWTCLQTYENFSDVSNAAAEQKALPSWDDGYALHAPVGSFEPNRFGLFDGTGNVMEWTASARSRYPHADRPARPWNTATPLASEYVLRGGGYDGKPDEYGRVTRRGYVAPHVLLPNIGVRAARSLDR